MNTEEIKSEVTEGKSRKDFLDFIMTEADVGALSIMSGYYESLRAVLRIRAHRKAIYGDSWKKQDLLDEHIILCNIKARRSKELFLKTLVGTADDDTRKHLQDSLEDLVNYALFALQLMGEADGRFKEQTKSVQPLSKDGRE